MLPILAHVCLAGLWANSAVGDGVTGGGQSMSHSFEGDSRHLERVVQGLRKAESRQLHTPENRADRIGDVLAQCFTAGRVCASNRDFVAFYQQGHPVGTAHIGWADLYSDLPHSVKWDFLGRVFKEAPPVKRDGPALAIENENRALGERGAREE